MLDLGGRPDGAISGDGQVLGCYLHGLFDRPAACTALLERAGLPAGCEATDYDAHRQAELDRLADTVEQYLDTRWLRSLLLPA